MSGPSHAAAVPEPAKTAPPAFSPARALRLQRQCSCSGSCESCKEKHPPEILQRKAMPGAAPAPAAPAHAVAMPSAPAAVPNASAAVTSQKAGKDIPPPAKTSASPHATAVTPALPGKQKAAGVHSDLPPLVRRVIATPGEQLGFAIRTDMEARFGHSFRDVRIHTNALAAESARAEHAHAYTVGEHIVFGAGQYRPETPEGRKLLAHELAHTVQQYGLWKSGAPAPSDNPGDYQHLEREADAVAQTVVSHAPSAGAPLSATHAAAPLISRIDSSEVISCDMDETERQWTSVGTKKNLKAAKVKRYSLPGEDVQKEDNKQGAPSMDGKVLVAVDMDEPFILPPEKGNVLGVWKQRMSGCNLEAIVDPGLGTVRTKAGLKQQRPPTDQLRRLWLQRVGWNSGYEEKWLQAVKATKAGKAKPSGVDRTSSFVPTRAMGTACQVDHILELQVGGNNTPENMQMLDADENQKSGRDIFNWLAARAVKVRDAFASDLPEVKIQSVLMRFSSIKTSTPICGPCCQADAQASRIEDTGDSGGGGVDFPLKAGGTSTFMVAASSADAHVGLAGSSIARNQSASTLISGLSLIEWTRNPKRKDDGGIVKAELDTKGEGRKKTALPPSLKGETDFRLKRDAADGALKLADKRPNIKFHYDFLSSGTFTSLNLEEDGSISGAGTIIPSFKGFLPAFDIAFDRDKLALSKAIPKDKLKLPIPGFSVTEARLGIELGPEFKPEGTLKFEVAPAGKQILRGDLTLSDDPSGLVVNGNVFATVPGTDEVQGNLNLKNNQWSGGVEIKAGDFGSKLKYVKSGEVSIRFSQEQGMSASGKVELAVPGVTDPVIASVSYDRDGWSYRATARFNPPRIKPVDIDLEYANGHLRGEGRTGFEFHQLSGTIHVRYRDEMFSGDGSLVVKTRRAEGSLKVEMHHRPNGDLYFTGEGQISFKVTDDLVASAGVKIDENEKVVVNGELAFTKPITLFKGFSGNYTFFTIEEDIPLPPPLSIGGIGLEAYIQGSLSAAYAVGPVLLEDVKATAHFQPLEKDPEVEMDLASRLSVAAIGSVSGSIGGGIKINAYIAYAKGGFDMTATATLKGGMNAPLHAHYKDGKITADVGFEASLALILSLALKASVEAKAGVGWLSVKTDKEWTLGSYTYDPGLSLGMSLKRPIHYESPNNFTLPTVDDITWVKPKLDGKNAVRSVAAASNAGEEHRV